MAQTSIHHVPHTLNSPMVNTTIHPITSTNFETDLPTPKELDSDPTQQVLNQKH